MKGLIRHLLDNAADHDALIKILWDTLDLCVVTTAEHRLLDAPPKTWSQNLRACRSSRSRRPWLIVSVHVDAGFFPAAATGR